MKIGFFGDSFCSSVVPWAEHGGLYLTYLKQLANHYNAEIVHTGIPGSSVGDVMLNQLQSVSTPDICIFVWSDIARLFHNEVRNINAGSANESSGNIWDAAKQYYKYLYDHYFATIQYKALLEYIDNHILSNFPKHIKIIHLWSFEVSHDPHYYYRWKNGVEIRPALNEVACSIVNLGESPGRLFNDYSNHLGGNERNKLVFNWIKEAIDNYSSGTLLTKEIIYE